MKEIKEEYVRSMIKPRPWDAHKGTCGRVLIVAGSTGMAGAAILSARAALRSGAGLVTVACPVYLFHIIQTAVPEATCINVESLYEMNLRVYDSIAFGPGVGCTAERYRQLEHILLSYDGPVIVDADGINSLCDFGLVPEIAEDAEYTSVSEYREKASGARENAEEKNDAKEPFPDVEGYNTNSDAAGYGYAFAEGYAAEDEMSGWPDSRRMVCILPELVRHRRGDVILTPHPGEADRLLEALDEPRCHELTREQVAEILTSRTGAIVILKGAGTLVATKSGSEGATDPDPHADADAKAGAPDAETAAPDARPEAEPIDIRRNFTGNPGMATGGSGDVLTGVLGALAASAGAVRKYALRAGREDEIPNLSVADAARIGVYIHGLAGDIAARDMGEIGMTSMDIAASLPEAFRQLTHR